MKCGFSFTSSLSIAFVLRALKRLFHFLGGIYFAIMLIATSALMVGLGTFLESQTGSHLLAVQWAYGHPFFLALLSLFFINILFSTLRRWPFQRKHIPFLMTHLGLLMIIGGTLLKNQIGLQGQLFVWEGSGNQQVLLPHTYALSLESKESDLDSTKKSLILLSDFQPCVLNSPALPHLTCKITGFVPHVQEKFETWIKGSYAYIAGFPLFPVHPWQPSQPFPPETASVFGMAKQPSDWSLIALNTHHMEEALRQAYLQGLTLRLKSNKAPHAILEIPLQQALEKPFQFASGEVSATLQLSSLFLDQQERPLLNLAWKSELYPPECFSVALQGQEALLVKSHANQWSSPSFSVDLIRSNPKICLIEDEQGHTFFFAFDRYGRVHGAVFSASHLPHLVSYDQGFTGYGIQTIVPISSFPSSREDKERALAFAWKLQLQQAVSQELLLAPPLAFFAQTCLQTGVDFSTALIEFLNAWRMNEGFLLQSTQFLSPQLQEVLKNLKWEALSSPDRQACLWTTHLLNQLERSWQAGEHPLEVLKRHHWPFLAELQQVLQSSLGTSPLNLLAQQISSFIAGLPPLHFPTSLSISEQAHLLSAYFRIYGIDARLLLSFQEEGQECLDNLEDYWRSQGMKEERLQQTVLFETFLTHHVMPADAPIKREDCRPGIVLEVQEGQAKQIIALAYDPTGANLRWPILKGRYLIRFQPQVKELPYRIRLRQARQIAYPHSPQIYSYESDVLITGDSHPPISQTLSMNHVYETWDGYRFYLAGVGSSADASLKRIQLAVNHDPVKYLLTYPGAFFVFAGMLLLFYRKK